uniref:Uncharacterized protein n=1 Tax=Romanomermis culicivorax TaxID=13658 RepID=A0A915JI78_ROMCU
MNKLRWEDSKNKYGFKFGTYAISPLQPKFRIKFSPYFSVMLLRFLQDIYTLFGHPNKIVYSLLRRQIGVYPLYKRKVETFQTKKNEAGAHAKNKSVPACYTTDINQRQKSQQPILTL